MKLFAICFIGFAVVFTSHAVEAWRAFYTKPSFDDFGMAWLMTTGVVFCLGFGCFVAKCAPWNPFK